MRVTDLPVAPATSPLMTSDEAAIYLRFVDAEGRPERERFYQWVRRANPRRWRVGANARSMRFRREDLDAVLVADGGPVEVKPSLRDYQRRRDLAIKQYR
jgi:hypothetical protein